MTSLTPPHDRLLTHIDDRSAALRAAAAGAPDLGVRVPSCPEWSLRDLVVHVGEVQRFWTLVTAAGPSDTPPARGERQSAGPDGEAASSGDTARDATGPVDTAPPGEDAQDAELLAWSEQSTALLIDALRAADPDDGCWTWWASSGAPQTVAAVARHQVQEAAIHAYDAQLAAGKPEALPPEVAEDGIDEFLTVSYGTAVPWPHAPAEARLLTAEGAAWHVHLPEQGKPTVTRPDDARPPHTLTLHAPASDLLLTLHRRISTDRIRVDGEHPLADRLLAWPTLD